MAATGAATEASVTAKLKVLLASDNSTACGSRGFNEELSCGHGSGYLAGVLNKLPDHMITYFNI
jgi:hypothetical protein